MDTWLIGGWVLAALLGGLTLGLTALLYRSERDLVRLRADQQDAEADRRDQIAQLQAFVQRLLTINDRGVGAVELSTSVAAATLKLPLPGQRLSPDSRRALAEALLDGFPLPSRLTDLQNIVRQVFGEVGLGEINWGQAGADTVEALLTYSESRDGTAALVQAARRANQGNALLRRWSA